MARKPGSTIGRSPIQHPAIESVLGGSPAKTAKVDPGKPPAGAKERVTMYLPVELADRLRDAAWWTRSTLASLAEDAFVEKLAKLEREHGKIEKRGAELKTGRPVKK